MMLNIKLPKGKVAKALLACAEVYLAHAEVQDREHLKEIEIWRKHMHMQFLHKRGGYSIAPPIFNGFDFEKQAKTFRDMAECCAFSTGDVYVSTELWTEIKGLYDT